MLAQLLSQVSRGRMASHLVLLCLLASALTAPLQDTPEVREAKAQFYAAFDDAKAGKHAALAPVNNDIQAAQIPNAYLDDTKPVADEKMNHKIAHDTAALGGLVHMQAEPVAAFYIAKTEEVAEAEKQFMEEFTVAEQGEHTKYAPANNDIQAAQIDNFYILDTQEVVDAKEMFMTYFAEAKLKAMALDATMDAVAETVPAVAAVKSAPTVVAVETAPAAPAQVVAPTFYNLPMVHGYPAFTYPLPMSYLLLPIAAPAAAAAASVATPEVTAEAVAVVEEA
eukprot:GFUD01002513.1.p1 GENE.GFUD01002513.1~~GFUD01002513.1.p1  ORF type:complete len:281 (+),score=86.61 GFUD01002513.1:68-910(+)